MPRDLSTPLLELLSNVDEELEDFLALGEFDEETQARLRSAFLPERISDTLNIEGIQVNPRVTRAVLEGLAIADSDKYAEREIRNVIDAHELVLTAVKDEAELTKGLIKQLGFLITRDLIDDAGSFRTKDVVISGAQVSPPRHELVEARIDELIAGYESGGELHPLARAAWLHREFSEIHPFSDGNGRTARLLQDFSVMKAGYLPVGIPAFRRREYYDALEQADFGDFEPLIAMIANSEQTALSKAGRVVRRVPDRQNAVRSMLQRRARARDRREEHEFQVWRARVEQLRDEFAAWVGSFNAESAVNLVRLKSWDPISLETWQEIQAKGWSRNSWLWTVFIGEAGSRGCSVLFCARRLDKVIPLESADLSPKARRQLGIQVLVSGDNGRYDFSVQDDRYVSLRAIGMRTSEDSFVAYEASSNGDVTATRRSDHELAERLFGELTVKAGWAI